MSTTTQTPSASSEQDRAWVREALEGDARQQSRAYADLEQKYRGPLTRHVGKMVREQQMVDDLVQEALIKAFGALGSYSPSYAFSTWLYKIASNHTIDYLRKKKLNAFSIDKPLPSKDGDRGGFEIPDATYRPDKPVVQDQKRELIQQAIDALPEKYRLVIELRHQQDKSYDEIAEALGLPLGTVKAHIFRARAQLYKFLKDQRDDL